MLLQSFYQLDLKLVSFSLRVVLYVESRQAWDCELLVQRFPQLGRICINEGLPRNSQHCVGLTKTKFDEVDVAVKYCFTKRSSIFGTQLHQSELK